MIARRLGSGIANSVARPSALERLVIAQCLADYPPNTDIPRSRDIIRDLTPRPQDQGCRTFSVRSRRGCQCTKKAQGLSCETCGHEISKWKNKRLHYQSSIGGKLRKSYLDERRHFGKYHTIDQRLYQWLHDRLDRLARFPEQMGDTVANEDGARL